MNKKTIYIILAILIIIIGYLVLSKNETKSQEDSLNQIHVTVINKSDQNIRTIYLKHEKGLITKNIKLEPKEKTTIIFNSPGENAYSITVFLENKEKLKSHEMYIEGGYKLIETIITDSIISTYENNY